MNPINFIIGSGIVFVIVIILLFLNFLGMLKSDKIGVGVVFHLILGAIGWLSGVVFIISLACALVKVFFK